MSNFSSQVTTQASLSSLFHWNPGSAIGKKKKLGGGTKSALKKKIRKHEAARFNALLIPAKTRFLMGMKELCVK